MNEIEHRISEKLAAAVAREIDVPALAKKLAPKVEKKLVAAMLKVDFADALGDCFSRALYEKECAKELGQVLLRAMRKLK